MDSIQSREVAHEPGDHRGNCICKVGRREKEPGACSLPLAELPGFTILVDLAGRASIEVASVLCLHIPQTVLLNLGLLLGKTVRSQACRLL